ncbi:MAG TPA: FAD-dependent oxidoreductase [Victivallales bacterium]|nr:FAD-dependent oxidoreductase [Victivallales bacterium]
MENINITIDDKGIIAEKGKTVYQIASENGIDIPVLCYNEKISHTTSCFVCLVKDDKTGKFLPSCSFVPSDGARIISSSDEVREMRQTALNLLLSEHSGDCEAPCTVSCPAHANVEEYVRAGKEGKFLKSLEIIKERIPLPMSIGRICPRFCEKDCRRNVHDKPVAINEFKRLAADLYYEEYMEELPELNGKKVAIIGAGPGGLSVAYYLRLMGIESIIYERMPEPGGMLRYEIPEFRLPKDILKKEIAHFYKMGIKIECGKELGKDVDLDELKKEFDAVAITIGCWKASSMRVDGEELAEPGIDWLKEVALNNYKYPSPGKTIVVGGGSTAMDCCRVPVRLGSKDVSCFYRRSEKEMPAERVEVEEAMEEGVKFNFLTAPLKLRKAGDKLVLTCQKMELGEPDASGRRRPVPVEGSEFDVEADTVISAIGQKTDAIGDLKTNKWGDIDVAEADNCMSDNVFAAGDCVSGAATVVEAVAGGRLAALGIKSYLDGDKFEEPKIINVSRGHWNHLGKDDLVYLKEMNKEGRILPHFIDMKERRETFKEVFPTFSKEEVMNEGERCIECSCTAKSDCKLKKHSEEYGCDPEAISGEKILNGYDNRHPSIIHDRMKCLKCGICVKICKEVVNQNLLSQKKRGFATTVESAFGKTLPVTCTECGACIEDCPVGALDWKNKVDK